MKFNDLRIAVRLAIAFATITLLIAFLGIAAHKALSNVAGDWGALFRYPWKSGSRQPSAC
ncbi:MAG TPA: hypothetical protein VF450_01335 [Noviherbaspirillum sp.]